MKSLLSTSLLINLILHNSSITNVNAENLDVLEDMLNKITQDTLAFKRHFETLLLSENRCDQSKLDECANANYDGCVSEYPQPACPGGIWAIPDCGKGKEGGCGAFFDFTASTLRLAPSIDVDLSFNPNEDSVKNTICYSKQAEPYMIEKTEEEEEYWQRYSTSAPWFHYGAEDGIFRIYPGNPKGPCPSTYDPRVRPWYVAGSSGPKDVVLVLDTSGSMDNYSRLADMKQAAIRVINTLGFADYVSVIQFNSDATTPYTYMNRATSEMKEELITYIEGLTPFGLTNFHKAFKVAFDVLEESISVRESTTNCHKAILFLTDGEMTDKYGTESDLYDDIARRLEFYSDKTLEPILFTYSFGSDAIGSDIPKEIACKHDGIWAQINDSGDLAESMGAYYKYFAYGLSQDEDFVAWVEPYEFATGVGLGTTASAPVYDRSVNPPIFVGVVGLDFPFSAMEKALGEENEAGKETVISKIVDRSIAQCPVLNITQCQREALGRDGERCSDACASTSTYEIAECSGVDHPFDVFHNIYNKGRSYVERACCNVGESREIGLNIDDIQVCLEGGGGLPRGAGIGILIGSIAGGCCCLGLFARYFCGFGKKGGGGRNDQMNNTGRVEHHSSVVTAEMETGGIQAIPVPYPSAPPASHY